MHLLSRSALAGLLNKLKKPSMSTTLITGIAASVFTGIYMLPQLYKIIKDKKADDLSYGMLAILFIGLCLWISYGILREDAIIIVANSFSLLVNISITIFAIRYKSRGRSAQDGS